jgi:hypothetical protein
MTRLTDEQLQAILRGCDGVTRFDDGNLMRYEHGGGRLALIPVPGDGPRKLIADFYHEDDREHFARLDPDTVRSIVTELLAHRGVAQKADALLDALQGYGFPVSDAAVRALVDGGSIEAQRVHVAAVDLKSALSTQENING